MRPRSDERGKRPYALARFNEAARMNADIVVVPSHSRFNEAAFG